VDREEQPADAEGEAEDVAPNAAPAEEASRQAGYSLVAGHCATN
jgi:hypothetical protein